MAIQGTDLLLVNRAGVDYKLAASSVASIQATDLLLVNRGGTDYKITGAAFKAGTFLDTDQFLVNRAGVDYKAAGSVIRTLFAVAPVIGTVTLSEVDAAGAAFTSQQFRTAFTLTTAGTPAATIGLKATVVSGGTTRYLVFNTAGAVTSIQTADPGFATMTTQTSPITLTFPATLPSGQAPDDELPAGTTIKVTMQASNTGGSSAKDSNTLSPARKLAPPASGPGGAFAGGFYGGQIWLRAGQVVFETGEVLTADRLFNIVISPAASGQRLNQPYGDGSRWGPGSNDIALNDGRTNNEVLSGHGGQLAWARAQIIAGFNDWYIPSRDEYETMLRALKPTTNNNATGYRGYAQAAGHSGSVAFNDGSYQDSGCNQNSQPPRLTAYSSTNPSQTGLPLFQHGGAEALRHSGGGTSAYATSTMINTMANHFASQSTVDLSQNAGGTDTACNIRIIRREPN